MNNGLKYGLYYGLIASAIAALQYTVFPETFKSPLNWALTILLPIVFMYMAAKAERNDRGGLLSFGEALLPSFSTFAIGSLLSSFASFAVLKFVPGVLERFAEIQGELAESMVGTLSQYMPEDANTDMAQMKTEVIEATMNMGFGTIMINWVSNLIMGLIIALIISAIVKRNPST